MHVNVNALHRTIFAIVASALTGMYHTTLRINVFLFSCQHGQVALLHHFLCPDFWVPVTGKHFPGPGLIRSSFIHSIQGHMTLTYVKPVSDEVNVVIWPEQTRDFV